MSTVDHDAGIRDMSVEAIFLVPPKTRQHGQSRSALAVLSARCL